ncbi:MAG: outer membrane lipid asymmetry maintenance protein MlaD [bacterium]|nr:outer membrane lipid asymmetry maintenance protein MlaD [bacterium]MDY2830106.1 outer membrane lipid asymmetry maintenance protein MlaD [Alphaproteobacteria bacterium]
MKVLELYTKEETKNLKMGLSVLGIILLAFFIILFSRDDISHKDGGKYYQIYARFNRTDGLMIGDAVRVAGMDVGRVVGAKLDDNFKAIMTLEVKEAVKLPDDSSAAIVSSGVMGNKYIEIEPGGSEDMIAPGGEFSYTQDAMVLEELIERIIGIGKAKRQSKKGE